MYKNKNLEGQLDRGNQSKRSFSFDVLLIRMLEM